MQEAFTPPSVTESTVVGGWEELPVHMDLLYLSKIFFFNENAKVLCSIGCLNHNDGKKGLSLQHIPSSQET